MFRLLLSIGIFDIHRSSYIVHLKNFFQNNHNNSERLSSINFGRILLDLNIAALIGI